VSLAFLVLFVMYVVHAVMAHRREDAERSRFTKIAGLLLQTPLFGIACYFAARQGVFSRHLVSPPHIGAGLLAGHLIFGISLLVTHRSCRAAAIQFFDLSPLWRFIVDNPPMLMRFLGVSAGEELIYRVAAQPLVIENTDSRIIGILIVAGAFSVVHRHFLSNPPGQSIEFAGFAILIGVLYYWTGSLILVLVIHAVRNIEIAYLEQIVKTEELDSDTPGANPRERSCLHNTPERT